jgi:hypothetical protein
MSCYCFFDVLGPHMPTLAELRALAGYIERRCRDPGSPYASCADPAAVLQHLAYDPCTPSPAVATYLAMALAVSGGPKSPGESLCDELHYVTSALIEQYKQRNRRNHR